MEGLKKGELRCLEKVLVLYEFTVIYANWTSKVGNFM